MVSAVSVALILNAVWDFSCALSILLDIMPLCGVHIGLWKQGVYENSALGRRLLAYLILFWGALRLEVGVIGGNLKGPIISYLAEAFVFGCETFLFGEARVGTGVCLVLFNCAIVGLLLLENNKVA